MFTVFDGDPLRGYPYSPSSTVFHDCKVIHYLSHIQIKIKKKVIKFNFLKKIGAKFG